MKRTNNYSKRVQDLLSTATPKQKAILICLENFDKPKMGEEPTITDEEVEAIKKSVKGDPKAAKILGKWIAYYLTFCDYAPFFGLAFAEYRSRAEEVIGYLLLADSYKQEENHLNTILQELRENNPEAEESFINAFRSMSFKGARGKLTKDGYVHIDASDLLIAKALMKLKEVKNTLSCLKSLIIALEEWAKKNRCKAIMPPSLIRSIEFAKEDYSLDDIPNYSRKLLHEKELRGDYISPVERQMAIFPYYDEVEPDPTLLETARERINMEASRNLYPINREI